MRKTGRGDKLIGLTPDLVRLIIKLIRFSKGGLSKEERQELGQDLLLLSYDVLGEVV